MKEMSSWHFFDDQGTLDFEDITMDEGDVNTGMSASTFVGFLYNKVGRPFKPSKHLPPASVQTHLGLQNMLHDFCNNKISLIPKEGKLQELNKSLMEIRQRESQQATLGEIMVLGGKLIFLLTSCFDKMARGGLQSFFHWLSENSAYTAPAQVSATCLFNNHLGGQKQQQALSSKHRITASLAMGIEFFLKGIPLLKPRIYQVGAIKKPLVVIYLDAEWIVFDDPPSISKGLEGILWQPGEFPYAAALDTPREFVDALSTRKTQIILLELMAAAGMLVTYGHLLRGEDVIFFIDNQSVCCALVKGCSRSWDIQLLSTCWQLLCLQLGCRVWIEWVPSE